jgi:hypothetical protein
MSNLERPSVNPRGPGLPPEDVDRLLRAFLRSEVPDPWPAPKTPALPRPRADRPARRWTAWRSRSALAAAVGLFLLSYLGLAGLFGEFRTPDAGVDPQGVVSQVPHEVRTPGGKRALMRETLTPGKKPTIRIDVEMVEGP